MPKVTLLRMAAATVIIPISAISSDSASGVASSVLLTFVHYS